MRRFVLFWLLYFTCLMSTTVYASTLVEKSIMIGGIDYNLDTDDQTAEVTKNSLTNYYGDIVIPSFVQYGAIRYTVTSIGDRAFSGCNKLRSIIIPESVTTIGSYAFFRCVGLTKIKIPDGVLSIYDNTFSECGNLESVTLGNSLTEIHDDAFYDCESLTSINIPKSLTYIGARAFYNCSSLLSIFIPNGVTSISEYAFAGCSGLTSITIFNGVTSIGSYAFAGCSGLTSVTIPNSVTSIGSWVFEGCSGLTSITIPNSIISISDCIFAYCSGLTSVNIPESVTSIGNGAFLMCKSLASITIPEGVTSVGDAAFADCSSLTSIIIPERVTNIGKNVFQECSGLKSVNIKCRNVGVWPSDIITLEEVMIGEKVRRIENNAFKGCNNLSKVHINNLASWCEIAFGNIYSNPLYFAQRLLVNYKDVDLDNLQIPDGVKVIGNYAFCNLRGLTSVSIPESIEYIGEDAFIECPNLNSVMINSPVVGSWFNWISSIKKVILGNNVTSIEKSAFSGCSGLSSVTIGDNVTKIDNNAFPFSTPIYVNRGTKSLLALWNAGYKKPIAINSNEVLKPPYMSVENVTQMTGTIKIHNIYADYTNMLNGEAVKQETITFRTRPEYTENVKLTATKDEVSFATDIKYTTASLGCYVDQQSVTASSMGVTASYIQGDANVTSQKIAINGVSIEDSILHLNGLRPNSSYLVSYTIKVEDLYDYTKNVYLKTEPLEFTNALPRVISKGKVVISSTSNLDADETEVGFEWRRTDWTEDFASKSAGTYLYQSTMEGYIRDLNTDFLWKFRPYYCSSDGMKFYGNWSGIDPTDFSFFEPTIHTYDKTNVDGNSAKVRGYVMRGTDDITNQGFKYWSDVNRTRSAPPSNAQTVEASGTIMEAKISGLAYASTYHYVAFVRTSKGETFYGEERTFTTSNSPSGLESVEYNKKETEPAIYDINGRKLSKPQRGVNILLMRDGSKRKLVVK